MDPSPQPECELATITLDLHDLPQRLVLEAPGGIHDHISARKPALAPAVDIGIAGSAELEISPDIDVPGPEVGVDVVVVTVRLVRHPVGRAEVDPAGDRSVGVVVENGDVHPVATLLQHVNTELALFERLGFR